MSSFLLTDIRIFDGHSIIENGSVLVADGRIAQVSSSRIPFNGPIFCRPGHTLLPGLIDTHIHTFDSSATPLQQSLRFGVTTVCDLHMDPQHIPALRAHALLPDCADFKTASVAATIDQGWPKPLLLGLDSSPKNLARIESWPKLATPEDGRRYVQERVAEGVDHIKLIHESGSIMGAEYPLPSLELQKTIVNEAHRHGLVVVAHAISLEDTNAVLGVGVDGLAHQFLDALPDERVIELYRKTGAHLNPTLVTLASGTAEGMELQEKYAHDVRVQKLITPSDRERMCKCYGFVRGEQARMKNAYEGVKRLKKAGVPVILGTDATHQSLGAIYGVAAHHELAILVYKCGFSPEEALRAGTSLAAERFRHTDRGTIQLGLRADLLLVKGNPLEDIDHSLNIRGVWTAGALCPTYQDNF